MSKWTLPLKVFYSTVISCTFVLPAIIGYALRFQVTKVSFWVLGLYGLIVFAFIVLQLTFASLNRLMINRWRRKCPPPEPSESPDQPGVRKASKVGLAVVGYREEPALFVACLESIRQLNYPDPLVICIVIDGNDAEDTEMAAIYQDVFPKQPVVNLTFLLSEQQKELKKQMAHSSSSACSTSSGHDLGDGQEKDTAAPGRYDDVLAPLPSELLAFLPSDTQVVCYLQPHQGKRHAMYTAFRVLLAAGCDSVVSTDSDTRFDPNAVLELERALHFFPGIGAAAGDVRIWNATDSLLSFMSSLRYWMAFNIERAAQSFNRSVTCVSGPMGIYRANYLAPILDHWVQQTFLGLECTYGDDRHLTNCVLNRGASVIYNHHAFCDTETPVTFLRWFRQQTRWSKSFYREMLWNARCLHKHSPWMAAELFYQGMYPFVLMFSIFYIMWVKSPWVLLMWLTSLSVIALLKTIYSCLVTFSPRFLLFPLYSIYYLFGLVPAKLWALISLWDVSWGTSARSASERKSESAFWFKLKQALPLIIWFLLIFAGICFNVIFYLVDPHHGPFAPEVPDPADIVFYPNPNVPL
ncbi:hypothetical protein DM01DRAFT_1381059 [Hesseltinella vesiculosa]|uniref:Nucleotide-diphospho-sugar transferase n=1 Tax=Hesseltinella vesiculosa TaxID=101127 RepID=A0A1X2GR30_9FUNG|nr:hypothetical protein DM01DRAFT_1381059 [Hesseltinella vesiculosa]